MFERQLPGRSAIVGLGEVNRAGKRAARRAARVYTRPVHVYQAAEPSSPASPTPLHAHVPTTNQENVRMVLHLATRRQQCAARRNSPHFFPGRWQSPYSSLVCVHTHTRARTHALTHARTHAHFLKSCDTNF